jgi:HSP20 family protein
MAIIRWDPWGELAALQRDVSQLMSRGHTVQQRSGVVVPPIDAYRTPEGLVVTAELPGVSPDQVEVSVQEGVLTISGQREPSTEVAEDSWVRRERAYGSFERSFSLPEGTDPSKITASFEHGVLELTIPEPAERQPQRIQVSTGRSSGEGQTVDVTTGASSAVGAGGQASSNPSRGE